MDLDTRLNGTLQAAEIINRSLCFCKQKLGQVDVAAQLRQGNVTALEYFRHGLAREVGLFLGLTDDMVQEVYLLPGDDPDQPLATQPLTLLVRLTRQTAALDSVVEALEHDLLEAYRELLRPATSRLNSLTNICFVDEDDLRHRRGLAAVIGSLHTPALCVWCR